jgi:hypothetical protein
LASNASTRSAADASSRAFCSFDALAAAAYPQGHLQHMASHLYLRVGRYADAVAANQRAFDTDVLLSQRCLPPALLLQSPAPAVCLLSSAAASALDLFSLASIFWLQLHSCCHAAELNSAA